MARQTRERLEDIRRAIAAIRDHVGGSLADPRIGSPVVLDAVLYNLVVIGEAAKNVDEQVQARAEGIPWSDYAGLRDIVAHQYFRIRREIVEDTVRRDLPRLEVAVDGLLEG